MMKQIMATVAIVLLALGCTLGIVYVALLGTRPRPQPATQQPFAGVVYSRIVLSQPRPNIVHLVAVDLTTPGLRFFVTPPDPESPRDYWPRTTGDFLLEQEAQIAING